MHYLITPFQNSTDAFITGCRDAFAAKYGTATNNKRKEANADLVVTAGPGCLAGLGRNDVLYVVGHGSQDGQHLMSDPQGTQKLAASDVAVLLGPDNWKLPLDHVKVKLVCCYGGGKLDGNKFDAAGSKGFFAEVLAKALGLKGYKNILVGGYPNPVYANASTTTKGVKVAFNMPDEAEGLEGVKQLAAHTKAEAVSPGSSQKVLPGKKYIRWFNAQGVETQWKVGVAPEGTRPVTHFGSRPPE